MTKNDDPLEQVIDPSTPRTTSPVNWFAGDAEFQMRPETTVTPLVCGEAAFSAVARALRGAKKSINMCFWGLDPAMLLERGEAGNWDPSSILGEILLRKAAEQDVQVRIVVWDHYKVGVGSGGSGNVDPTDADLGGNSANLAKFRQLTKDTPNIDVRMTNSLSTAGLIHFPSFHQKSIIVDIEDPGSATAFVMGHNMLVNYWSTTNLSRVNPRRQFYLQIGDEVPGVNDLTQRTAEAREVYEFYRDYEASPPPGHAATVERFRRQYEDLRDELSSWDGLRFSYSTHQSQGIKPYLDISTQIWGKAVADVYTNFARVWDANGSAPDPDPASVNLQLFRPNGRRSPAQVAATFPLAGARDIEKFYLQAMKNADRYILMVNQYFRNWPVSDEVISWWQEHRPDKRVPLMVVTNDWNISDPNEASRSDKVQEGHDGVAEKKFIDAGFPISMTKMLTQESGYHSLVYVHAKLLIVDDVFYTIGSANYNQRGLMSDPELNIGVVDGGEALQLRREVMNILVGDAMNEWGHGSDPMAAFETWKEYVAANTAASQTSSSLPHGRVVQYDPNLRDESNFSNRLAQTTPDTGTSSG